MSGQATSCPYLKRLENSSPSVGRGGSPALWLHEVHSKMHQEHPDNRFGFPSVVDFRPGGHIILRMGPEIDEIDVAAEAGVDTCCVNSEFSRK